MKSLNYKFHIIVEPNVLTLRINIIPTCDNLLCKRVDVPALCPVCKEENENVFHPLVDCRFARQCWYASVLGFSRDVGFNYSIWLHYPFRAFP